MSRRARRARGRPSAQSSGKSARPSGGVSKSARRAAARALRTQALTAARRARVAAKSTRAPLLLALFPASSLALPHLQQAAEALSSAGETLCVSTGTRAALDVAKVADVFVIVFAGDKHLDDVQMDALAAVRAQGLPKVLAVAFGDGAGDVAVRRLRSRILAAESMGEEASLRPLNIECEDGRKKLLRRIAEEKEKEVAWRARYGYVRVEGVRRVDERNMELVGWIRGRGLSANELVHVTGVGSFAVVDIRDVEGKVLSKRIEELAEGVESEAEVDENMGEQTWIEEMGNEDTFDADEEQNEMEGSNDADDSGPEEGQDGDAQLTEAQQSVFGTKRPRAPRRTDGDVSADEMQDDVNIEEDEEPGEEDDEMCVDEEEARRLREAAQTDAQFPDEVDTPIDQPARIRFARYRGLKSFRTSEWDPKEQLPREYARLFQFRDLRATRKRVLAEAAATSTKDAANFAWAGVRAVITLRDVSEENAKAMLTVLESSKVPLIASGMLRHENKRSVVHFGMQRVDAGDDPIRAKTPMEMHCGFVRFSGRPMFSEQNGNSDKHKMERFLVHDRYTVASFYGPAVYAPAPALMFRIGGKELIAAGSCLGADPDRIILKRIVLTGYPFKTQKRKSVAKFMFFNADDIRWFKPVELWTKMGRSGHILEPVGTHGHMKCIFDSTILHHDTICMTLYKRVYPKLIETETSDKRGSIS